MGLKMEGNKTRNWNLNSDSSNKCNYWSVNKQTWK